MLLAKRIKLTQYCHHPYQMHVIIITVVVLTQGVAGSQSITDIPAPTLWEPDDWS